MAGQDEARAMLLAAYRAALESVEGRARTRHALQRDLPTAPVFLIAVGKAASAMVRGAQEALGEAIRDAFIVTRHGYGEPLPWSVHEAGHPLPDEASLAAGAALFDYIDRVPPTASVLVLLSGGASALVEQLPQGMTFAQLRRLNAWLLASGLPIETINAIRRRTSLIKGGRLAARLAPRTVIGLAISDVAHDEARVIGSGPLTADAEGAHPLEVAGLPDDLRALLEHPPPAPGADCFRCVRFQVIARLADAKQAAATAARAAGYDSVVHAQFIDGDAVTAGEALAQKLIQFSPRTVHVWGGEPTVRLPPAPGRGGRAQQLALAAARVLRGQRHAYLLAAGTDGSDGATEDAGAIIDGGTIARGEAAGLDAGEALAGADAGAFLEAAGDLIQTGPTGTNVMDLMLGLRLD